MASVGMTASQAADAGIDVITATADIGQQARTNTDGTAGGLLILVADRARGVLIGTSGLGPGADEWISEASVAIRAEVPLPCCRCLTPSHLPCYESPPHFPSP